MLKSLEKLKDSLWYDYSPIESAYDPVETEDIADEIQAEVDRYYLPRPLFEDGEPVQFGDSAFTTWHHGMVVEIDYECGGENYSIVVDDGNKRWRSQLENIDDRVRRATEPDSQEKIDTDLFLTPCEYCDKYGLDASYDASLGTDQYPNIVMRKDLLERQRRLDGVER